MKAILSNPLPWFGGGGIALAGALFFRFSSALGLTPWAPLGALAAGAGLLSISLGVGRLDSRSQKPQTTPKL